MGRRCERLQDLESLRRSEKKYRLLSSQLEAILDHIPGLIFYKDIKNNYIRVNKYVADAHKKEKTALEGVSLYDRHIDGYNRTKTLGKNN